MTIFEGLEGRVLKPRTLLLLSMACLAFGTGLARGRTGVSIPGVSKGMPYAEARAKLLSMGYVPYQPKGPHLMTGPPCEGREEICRAYPETAACAGTGRAQCAFLFIREMEFVEVQTVNEGLATLQVDGIDRLTRKEADTDY